MIIILLSRLFKTKLSQLLFNQLARMTLFLSIVFIIIITLSAKPITDSSINQEQLQTFSGQNINETITQYKHLQTNEPSNEEIDYFADMTEGPLLIYYKQRNERVLQTNVTYSNISSITGGNLVQTWNISNSLLYMFKAGNRSLHLNYDNSSNQTTLTLFQIDITQLNNFHITSKTLQGSWVLKATSTQTLSCILLFETTTNYVSYIQYKDKQLFQILNTNYQGEGVSDDVYKWITNDCDYFATSTAYYKISQPIQKNMFTPILAISEDLHYLISQTQLCKVNETYIYDYSSIFQVGNCSSVIVKSFVNRIVIACSELFQTRLYVLLDSNNKITVLKTFHQTYQYSYDRYNIKLIVSPQLTKIFLRSTYIITASTINSTATFNIFKSVDYIAGVVNDITIKDQTRFSVSTKDYIIDQQIKSIFDSQKYYELNQRFLAIRNDSNSNIGYSPYAVMQGYQFANNSLFLINTRYIPEVQQSKSYNLIIQAGSVSLVVYSLYLSSNDLITNNCKIFSFDFGYISQSSNFTNIYPLLIVNSSYLDKALISPSQAIQFYTAESIVNAANNQSYLYKVISLNRAMPLNYQSNSYESRNKLIWLANSKSSLSCILAYYYDIGLSQNVFQLLHLQNNQIISIPVPSNWNFSNNSLMYSIGQDCSIVRKQRQYFNVPKQSSIILQSSGMNLLYSSDLRLVYDGSNLYKLNSQQTAYTLIYQTNSSCSYQSSLFNYKNRIVVYCFSLNNNICYINFKILVYKQNVVTLLGQIQDKVSYSGQTNQVPRYAVSPQLTKILYLLPFKQTQPFVSYKQMMKGIDYDGSLIYNIFTFDVAYSMQSSSFTPQTYDFQLADEYLIVNKKYKLQLNKNLTQKQISYQIFKDNLIMIDNRIFQPQLTNNYIKTVIDPTSNSSEGLTVLYYYKAYSLQLKYNIYEYKYGRAQTKDHNPVKFNPTITPHINASDTFINISSKLNIIKQSALTALNLSYIQYPIVILSPFQKTINFTLQGQQAYNERVVIEINRRSQQKISVSNALQLNFTIKSINLRCYASQSDSVFTIYKRQDNNSFIIYAVIDISSIIIIQQSMLIQKAISDDCTLMIYNNKIIEIKLNSFRIVDNNFTDNFKLFYTDNLVYLINANILYKYQPTTVKYQLLIQLPHFSTWNIYSNANRIIVRGEQQNEEGIPVVSLLTMVIIENDLKINVIDQDQLKCYTQHKFRQLLVSPLLTKLHYICVPVGQIQQLIVFKHIDYQSKRVVPILLNSPKHFKQTIQNMNLNQLQFVEYILSDNFVVIRNQTGAGKSPNSNSVQDVYQFFGDTLYHLRQRMLSAIQKQGYYQALHIDGSFSSIQSNQLSVVYYDNYLKNRICQIIYGNIQSLTPQMVLLPVTKYISYKQPNSTNSLNSIFINRTYTNYISFNGKNATNFTMFVSSSALPNHYQTGSFAIDGIWQLLAQADGCKLIHQMNLDYYMIYRFDKINKPQNLRYNVTAAIKSLPGSKKPFAVTKDCATFTAGYAIFEQSTVRYDKISPASFTDNFTYFDGSLDYALSKNQQFWKYNPNLKVYELKLKINQLPSTSIQQSLGNIFAKTVKNNSLYQIDCFINTMGSISQLPASIYTQTYFISSFSSNYTSIIMIDAVNFDSKIKFQIVLPSNSDIEQRNKTIEIPTFLGGLQEDDYYTVLIQDQWIYLQVTKINNSIIDKSYQFIYFIQGYTKLKLIKSRQMNQIKKTSMLVVNDSTLYVLSRQNVNENLVVDAWTANNNQIAKCSIFRDFMLISVNNKIRFCPIGCGDCLCTTCRVGFVLDQSIGNCLKCGPNCVSCEAFDPMICLTCISGTFLSQSNKCQQCSYPCRQCFTSNQTCTKCESNYYLNSNQSICQSCPINCKQCNKQNCPKCNDGLSLNGNICTNCSPLCSSCLSSNINICTSCDDGLQLLANSCKQCPLNCIICKNSLCLLCLSGYYVHQSGQCVLNCDSSCLTCVQNSPSNCTSCYDGSILKKSVCQFDLTCNITASCLHCGLGNKLVQIGGSCVNCFSIPHCIQCSPFNGYLCSICQKGYFSNNGKCDNCPSNCITCFGPTMCIDCSINYTLSNGRQFGLCTACIEPCLTCSGSSNVCLSCKTGYHKVGHRCQIADISIGFSLVLNSNLTYVLLKIPAITTEILKVLKFSTINSQCVVINEFREGSVILIGSIFSPSNQQFSSDSVVAYSNTLTSYFTKTSTIGGIKIASFSFNAKSIEQKQQSSNIALIVGLVVGLTALIVFIVLAIIYYIRRKKAEENNLQTSHTHTHIEEKYIDHHHQVQSHQTIQHHETNQHHGTHIEQEVLPEFQIFPQKHQQSDLHL